MELSNLSLEKILIVINSFLIIILVFLFISSNSKIKKLRNKYNRFMSGMSDKNFEQLLEENLDKVKEVTEKNKAIEAYLGNIDKNLDYCIQKVGIVRFNAFENVGSDQSFSIALLDNNNNGVVISGIYSRDSSSTYAKPITDGKSKYFLTSEEEEAISTASKIERENY